jgi:hypothetical protein
LSVIYGDGAGLAAPGQKQYCLWFVTKLSPERVAPGVVAMIAALFGRYVSSDSEAASFS